MGDSDEARDLFRDTAATFIQLSHKESEAAKAQESARKVLAAAASKNHSAKLLVLAQSLSQAQAGVFDKIIAAINELEKELNATKKSDQEEFDGCTKSINDKQNKISGL